MTTATKPVSRKVDTMPAAYGVKAKLAVTLHPNGLLSIRENGRRESSAVYFSIAELYVQGVRKRVAAEKLARKKARIKH